MFTRCEVKQCAGEVQDKISAEQDGLTRTGPGVCRVNIPCHTTLYPQQTFPCLALVITECGVHQISSQQSISIIIVLQALKAFQAKQPHLVLYSLFLLAI